MLKVINRKISAPRPNRSMMILPRSGPSWLVAASYSHQLGNRQPSTKMPRRNQG
ncbi:hypothetical protein D3C78_1812850 [compost metagenome]